MMETRVSVQLSFYRVTMKSAVKLNLFWIFGWWWRNHDSIILEPHNCYQTFGWRTQEMTH